MRATNNIELVAQAKPFDAAEWGRKEDQELLGPHRERFY